MNQNARRNSEIYPKPFLNLNAKLLGPIVKKCEGQLTNYMKYGVRGRGLRSNRRRKKSRKKMKLLITFTAKRVVLEGRRVFWRSGSRRL